MFETSQPNSDEFNTNTDWNREPASKPRKKRDCAIKSLQDLSLWIDAQLAELEAKYQAFESPESNRDYYQR